MIVVRLHRRCPGEEQCSDVKAANEYFKAGWLMVLSNKIRFDSNKYGEESIIREAIDNFIPV